MCFFSRSHVIDRLRSKSRSHPQEGDLCNLHSSSSESIALPETSVPHRNGNLNHYVLEDAKALRDIFSTPSSVRGYEAARGIPKPDDSARHTPAKPANGGMGALGHAVKLRLSENRLSKESPKTVLKKKRSEDSPEKCGVVDTSYRSTGLSDILISRTASEGGYDSDARAISTVRLRMSSDPESLNISPEYLTGTLRSQKDASPEKSNSAPAMLGHMSDLLEVSADNHVFHEQVTSLKLARACNDVQEVTVPVDPYATLIKAVGDDGKQEIVPSTSEALSDEQSLHLGDMRISQRLASASKMPMTSLSSTNFGSSTEPDAGADISPDMMRIAGSDMQRLSLEDDLPWHLQRQPSTTGRYPSFVAQEHNRRPSDPKTKRLFEDATDGSKLHRKWRSVTNAGKVQASLKEEEVVREDAGSPSIGGDELPHSRAPSLKCTIHSETIKNPNSLAIPGRRASAAMDQRYGSFGQVFDAEGDTCFSKDEKQHSLQAFEDGLAPHEQGSDEASAYGESGSVSRHEAMSEIENSALRGKKYERVSVTDTNTQAPRSRRHGNSTETQSVTGSQGWLTQGRRSGFGYDFVERTSSGASRSSREKDVDKGPRDERAANVWDRAFRKARSEESIESTSKNMLSVPFWSHCAGRKISTSSACEQQGPDLRRPRSVVSERKATPSEPIGGYLDPIENHQRVDVEAWRPLLRSSPQLIVRTRQNDSSQASSIKESPRKRSLLDIRRYTIGSVSNGSIASSSAPTDFPSWCKFPSYTRQERNSAAGDKDGVSTKDFSPPTPDLKRSQFRSDLTVHKKRSASSYKDTHSGSWRKRALRHVRRKSKSMTFTWGSGPPKHKEVTHRGFFLQLRDFYHSQSSDLRRLQAGHRSSVTLSRESKYPELDIPAGFGPLMLFDVSPKPFSRMTLDQVGILDSTGEDNADSTEQKDGELWRTGTETTARYETKNCFPAREAKKLSPQMAMPKSNLSSGFDSTLSSRISEERTGDMTKSDTELSSALQHHGNGTSGSFVSITASNGFGDGSGDFGVQTREFRLASTELRDSTVDFQTALMEQERRSKDDLLRLAQGMEGAGAGDGDGKLGERKEDREQNTA